MKLCVFGAGAIGGYLAGLLAASGVETSVVARVAWPASSVPEPGLALIRVRARQAGLHRD